jgi:HTH-type transcriptional regulator/antitoxin HipB
MATKLAKQAKKPMKMYSMEDVSDELLGKRGTKGRDNAERWFDGEIEKELETREMFGRFIKLIRKSQGLTQHELAYRLGVKKSAISKLESSDTNPTVETFLKIMNSMNMTLYVRALSKKPIAEVRKTRSKELVPA